MAIGIIRNDRGKVINLTWSQRVDINISTILLLEGIEIGLGKGKVIVGDVIKEIGIE